MQVVWRWCVVRVEISRGGGFAPAAAHKAAAVTTPTVDFIDGDKLCDLVRDQQIGLRIVAQVDEGWF